MENNWTAVAENFVLFAPAGVAVIASAILWYSGWIDHSQRKKYWLRASEIALIVLGIVWAFQWPFAWPLPNAGLALEWRLVAWAQGVIVYHVAVSYWIHKLKGTPVNWREGSLIVATEAATGVAVAAAYSLSWYFIAFYTAY